MPHSQASTSQDRIPYVDRPAQIAQLAHRLAAQKVIAFDTEFLWEKSYSPHLALIQVADGERAWVVDPLVLSKAELQPLLDVLVSDCTLKVAHAVDQDQMCLHHSYGIVAAPVLDTAVAAALSGMGDQIGLSTMLDKLLRISIDKGYSRTNWMKRPLPAKMLKYAANDVAHLPTAAEALTAELRALGRLEWAMDLSAKAGRFATAHFEPHALAKKLAESRRLDVTTFGVLKALISWREDEARRLDLPRRWLAEDKILIKLATARPTSVKQLEDFRGVGGVNRPQGAGRILKAIRRGLDAPADGYTRPERKRSPTAKESAALVVLRCFLNSLAAEHKIPMRLLIEADDMVELLRGNFEDVEALGATGILEPRPFDLVGQELIEILNGRRSLRIVDGAPRQERG